MKGAALGIKARHCLVLFVSLLLLSCEAEEPNQAPEPSPPVKPQVQYLLRYSADDNGSIQGVALQHVMQGKHGSEVTAIADEGYHFVAWSDGDTTPERIDRNVVADLDIIASFAINQYTLSYTADGNGTIKGTEQQVIDYGKDGSSVTAEPAQNHHFTAWSDGSTDPVRIDRKVTGDIAVTANFALDQLRLNYTAGFNGTITGPATQQVGYGGSGATVTAVPADGYHFVSWSDGVTDAKRTDHDVTAELNVSASFSVNQYTLSYSAGAHGSIDGPESLQVGHAGDGSQVIAVPDRGYHFVDWSDGVKTASRIDKDVSADLAVRANFAVDTYLVGGSVTGLVEGTRLVLQMNERDDLTVTDDGRFEFPGQLLDGESFTVTVLSQPTSPNQVCTVTSAHGIVAGANVTDLTVNCKLKTYTVGGTLTGLPGGDRVILQNNGKDTLTVEANGAFSFTNALEDGSSYEVKVSSPPKRPNWTCKVNSAGGIISGSDVADVAVDCYVKAVLKATPGIRSIKLTWNSQDFDGVTFNLCRARAEIAVDQFSTCQEITEGDLETKISSPFVAGGLKNDIPYWFQLEVKHADDRRSYSNVIESMAYGGLNDSGIDWCANDAANYEIDGMRIDKVESCKRLSETHPGQDAFHGRDSLALARKLDKTGNGQAGFDFTRLCRNGNPAGKGQCPPNPIPGDGPKNWGCLHDNVTGLTWEVKTDQGLQARDNTYSWFNPDQSFNGGAPGLENVGQCKGSSCDTFGYVKAINDLELCGISEWRLPTRRELLSIVDNGRFKPAADPRVFPNMASDYYWSSSTYADQPGFAWRVFFLYGESSPDEKNQGSLVRLVNGRTLTFGLDNPR